MSKSGSKSLRFGTLLEQLQKLCLASSEGKNELDVEQLRYTTNKIQQLLSSQEKCRKDLMTKFTDGISTLLVALEITADTQVVLNIMGCLCELLTTGKRASVLAAKGTVDILLRGIVSGSKEGVTCEEVLLLSHIILTKVGPKDRKLCVKARLMGALQVTLNMIKNNTTNFKILQPTLQMLKLYCANSVNCSLLGKAGAIGVLLKITSSCGHKRVMCLKLILDIIAALVKSKSGAAKAVGHSAVSLLLQMACDWQRTDHHNRQTGVRKSLLTILKNITMTKTGKKAFIQADGIKILYSLSLESLDCRELDGVNNLSSQILRRCFPTNRLPVQSLSSPVVFPLLDLNSAPGSNADYYLDGSGDDESSDVESEEEEEESGSESLEDKDQPESKANKEQEPQSGEGDGRAKVRDDLNMYDKFFPELFEFQDVELNKSVEEDDVAPDTIVIPTAGLDPHGSPGSSAVYSPQPDATAAARGVGRDTVEALSPAVKCSRSSVHSDASDDSGASTRSHADSNKTCASMTSEQLTVQDRARESQTPSPMAPTSSVLPILKKTAPDLYGHFPPLEPEPLGQKRSGMQRTMIFRDIERLIHPQRVVNRVVYDLDALLKETPSEPEVKQKTSNKEHLKPAQSMKASNCSISEGDRSPVEDMAKPLKFESRFESGNLRKAVQVRDHEYDLILNPDVNCKHHHQWFYFEVRNMEADVPYRFNIVNCEKLNSQFNFGMQPVFYSTQEAMDGRPGWVRAGSGVCYYRNYFARFPEANVAQRGKTYYTTTFTVTFPHADDVCYFAYHYPYTYSLLQTHLQQLESSLDPAEIFYRRSTLCHTLSGVPCDVITITACPTGRNERAINALRNRPYIFLSARVHPGESNSSWVMKGIIDFLLSNSYTARQLREMCIFKIVPMLNPDGVINGCHRCSLSGDDLNRRWINPSMLLHPTVYHTKGLLLYLQALGRAPLVYCDLHGHSRKKNVFMYGCSTAATVAAASSSSSGELDSDVVEAIREKVAELSGSDSASSMEPNDMVEDPSYRTLPRILHNIAPAFSLGSCSFIVEPAKESTARVVVWREIGVTRSYTMESTYSGCDQGPYKGYHVGTRELEEMGRFFCAGLLRIGRSYLRREGLRQIFDSASSTDLAGGASWIRTSELFMPATPYTYENRKHDMMA